MSLSCREDPRRLEVRRNTDSFSSVNRSSMDRRAAALIGLLLSGLTPVAANEEWDLWEEFIDGNAPVGMRLVGRFPSSEACQSRARQMFDTPPPDSVRRLGYTCFPAAPPRPSTSEASIAAAGPLEGLAPVGTGARAARLDGTTDPAYDWVPMRAVLLAGLLLLMPGGAAVLAITLGAAVLTRFS